MTTHRPIARSAALWLLSLPLATLTAQAPPPAPAPETWNVTVGKSMVVDSPLPIERISVADPTLAEVVAVDPRQVLVNGRSPGETSVIVWQDGGGRLVYNLKVHVSSARLDAVRHQIALEFPSADVSLSADLDSVFVRGTVKDVVAAGRISLMAGTLGKVINLLHVEVPPVQRQILVKVRFLNVDRTVSRNLSVDLASGAFNQSTALGPDSPISTVGSQPVTLSDAVNIFLFRKDLNLAVAIQALATKNLIETLAEPTVPAVDGKPASFVAGGEFPFPVVQPGANGAGSAISIQWREYGVRLDFTPTITPRGTIHLQVAPEVSSLDYAHTVTVAGTTIPALSVTKVHTDIELDSGQSFVIAGLLDNQTTDNLSKVPGIGDVPILGKLFQSKIISRNNSELLVIVTPEIVRPIPAGQSVPDLNFPQTFMPDNTKSPLRHPGMDVTGPVPVTPPEPTMPVEKLQEMQRQPNYAPQAPSAGGDAAGAPAAGLAAPVSAQPGAGQTGGIQK